MAEGLTFGKVVKGVALGTLAVGAVAVGADDLGEWIAGAASDATTVDGIGEAVSGTGANDVDKIIEQLAESNNPMEKIFDNLSPEKQQFIIDNADTLTETQLLDIAQDYDANSWGNKVGDFLGGASDKAAGLFDAVENKIGADDYAKETFQNIGFDDSVTGVYDVAKEAGGAALTEIKELPSEISAHTGLVAGSAVVGGVGVLGASKLVKGKHTARVEQERGGSRSNISAVAGTAGTAARRTAGLGVDLIKTAGNTVGGVADSVNHAVRGA